MTRAPTCPLQQFLAVAAAFAFGCGTTSANGSMVPHAATQSELERTQAPIAGRLSPPIDLEVWIEPEGATFVTSSGAIAPGCAHFGRGVTVPARDRLQDLPAIAGCARRLKEACADCSSHPVPIHDGPQELRIGGNDRNKTVVVHFATGRPLPAKTLLAISHALAADGEGELFPDVILAVDPPSK